MRYISQLIAGTLVLSVALVGCTQEGSSRRNHEGEVATIESDAAEQTPTLAAMRSPPQELVARFNARLDRKVLDLELRRQTPTERQSLYNLISEAAEAVNASAEDDANRKMILQTFSNIATAGCGAKLDICTYTPLLKGNSECRDAFTRNRESAVARNQTAVSTFIARVCTRRSDRRSPYCACIHSDSGCL